MGMYNIRLILYIKTIQFARGEISRMKKIVFRGCATALITPFKYGKIDYAALSGIIDMQLKAGVSALVIGGTTGEVATLSDKERYALYEFSKEKTDGRCKLILGVGTNDTQIAVRHTRRADKIGCDALLAVTPYYNKGTDEGIYTHYMKIADASGTPIILYNVPGRTGVNLSLSVLERLALCERIVGIKEASDSQDRLIRLSSFGEALWLYAGNDSAIQTVLSLGGAGVISVLSNLYPKYIEGMCRDFMNGEEGKCHYKQIKILDLVSAVFAETNPSPIKYAMAKHGLCKNELRLPLFSVSEKNKKLLDDVMSDFEKDII